jgi:broad specificity phosphatase PhoE
MTDEHINGECSVLFEMAGNNADAVTIFLVRHGETPWNQQGRVQTWSDGIGNRLTREGKADAWRKGAALADEPIAALYHSELYRSRQTTEIMGERIPAAELIRDARLNDGSLAYFDGLSKDECRQRFPAEYAGREGDKFHYRLPHRPGYPHAESLSDVVQRVAPLLREIEEQGRSAVLVGHLAINRAILYSLMQPMLSSEEASRIMVPNAGFYRIELKGGCRHVSFYDGSQRHEGIRLG